MVTLLERRRGIQEYARNIRLLRLLRLYDSGLPVTEIARLEKVTRTRIYQLLNAALAAKERGAI